VYDAWLLCLNNPKRSIRTILLIQAASFTLQHAAISESLKYARNDDVGVIAHYTRINNLRLESSTNERF